MHTISLGIPLMFDKEWDFEILQYSFFLYTLSRTNRCYILYSQSAVTYYAKLMMNFFVTLENNSSTE